MKFFYKFHTASLLALIFFLISCRAQIRNGEEIRNDPFLKYLSLSSGKKSHTGGIEKKSARFNNIAIDHLHRLEVEKAEKNFKQAVRNNPAIILPYLNFARFYLLFDAPERARRVLNRLIKNRKINDNRLLAAAEQLFAERRNRAGLFLLDAMINSRRSPYKSAIRNGRYYLSIPEYAVALDYFDKALKFNRLGPEALFGTGTIYYLAGDYQRSTYFLNLALKNGGIKQDIYYMLIDSFYKLEHPQKVLEIFLRSPRYMRTEEIIIRAGSAALLIDWRYPLNRLFNNKTSTELKKRSFKIWYGAGSNRERNFTEREFQLLY